MTVMDTLQREILEVKMEQEMISLAEKAFGRSLEECTDRELYHVIRKAAFQQPDQPGHL